MRIACEMGFSHEHLCITLDVIEELQAHAEQSYPMECCGVLLGGAGRSRTIWYELLRGENVARESPTTRFELDPGTLLRGLQHARSRSDHVLAFYHSHPDGWAIPSEGDSAGAWLGHHYVIVPIWSGRAGWPVVWVAGALRPVAPEGS